MNAVIDAILSRRSVRRYKSDVVSLNVIQQIVEAGLYAPNAMGRQAWHIVVASDADKIAEIDHEVKAATARMPDNPYKSFVGNESYTINYHAPVFVIVSGNVIESPRNVQLDCALVLGNMFLAAHSLGVGSCWINQLSVLNEEPDFRRFMSRLGIPENNNIFGCACFGYADGQVSEAAKRRENNVIYYTKKQ
ncbi:MAG: nitroreductase [Planctomycetaceae bacterium]|jgi:nitroreductase|nr:nitroreductase [Planctomycetaceae bacterium]